MSSQKESQVVASTPLAVGPTTSAAIKLAGDVFAGTCGGISVTVVGHPFDTVKVRLQTQPTKSPIYNGAIDCVKKTVKWEGFSGLYKGVTSPLAGQMFFRASLFGAFGYSQRLLSTNADGTIRKLTTLDYYKAGLMTGFLASFTEGPIDFYKSQLQVQIIKSKMDPKYKSPYNGVWDVVKATIKENGIRGPFQGLGATIVRNTPANAAFLGSFQVMKEAAAKKYNCHVSELPFYVVMAAAGLGGILYWSLIFPVDVVKSAMASDAIAKSERVYPDMKTTVTKLWNDGGIKRFYRGFSPCIMRAAPANAAMLYTVDTITQKLFPK